MNLVNIRLILCPAVFEIAHKEDLTAAMFEVDHRIADQEARGVEEVRVVFTIVDNQESVV